MATIKLTNVKKVYANASTGPGSRQEKPAVCNFNLEIADKEFVVFVGPSGCGKSTTLRMIAGLEDISDGTIEIDGKIVNDLQPKDRDVSMVFQNYALYPHLTVYENMAFPLRLMRHPRLSNDEIYNRVVATAKTLGITQYLTRKPKALSGGQRQRVAIGRAMVRDSKVFLMDEPLSNLDAKLRNAMRAEIILLRKKINSTFVYVTHDQTEAMTLGDRIVIMRDGYIMQVGTPAEVFEEPANLFVAGFIGAPQMNFVDTELTKEGNQYYVHPFGEKIPVTGAKLARLQELNVVPQKITLGFRPEHTQWLFEKTDKCIPVILQVNEMMGSEAQLHVYATAQKDDEYPTSMVVRVPTVDLSPEQRKSLIPDRQFYITFDPKVLHFFSKVDDTSLLAGGK